MIRRFIYKEAAVCIQAGAELIETASKIFRKTYDTVEGYLKTYPAFHYSLQPMEAASDAPEVIRRMARAAKSVGVGPMASVAGGIAQMTVENILQNSFCEKIVIENGGDIVFFSPENILIKIFCANPTFDRLALNFPGSKNIIAVCSSSGKIGHSLSFGQADLVTVIANDGFEADAWATKLANLARDDGSQLPAEIEEAINSNQFQSTIIIYNNQVYLGGDVPQITTVEEERNDQN